MNSENSLNPSDAKNGPETGQKTGPETGQKAGPETGQKTGQMTGAKSGSPNSQSAPEGASKASHSQSAVRPPPQTTKSRVIQGFKTFLKIAVAAFLIYWMINKGALDFGTFARLATLQLSLGCGLAVFAGVIFNNWRWMILLRGQGFQTSTAKTLPLSFIGMFFNFFMPGGVGGDVVKGYYLLQEHPHQRVAGAVSIFMDRVAGFFMMITTAFIAIFFNWEVVSQNSQMRVLCFGVAFFFAAFLIFFTVCFSNVLQKPQLANFFFRKLPGGHLFKQIYEILHSYRKSPRSLFHACWISLFSQGASVILVMLVGQAMHIDLPISVYLFLVPIGLVAQALPVAPAGIGVGQAAFFYLFSLFIQGESQLGPIAVTTMQIMGFGAGLIGAFFYLRRKSPQSV